MPQGCWEDLSNPQDTAVGNKNEFKGLEAKQALRYVPTMSLENSGGCLAPGWCALPAFHDESF